MVEVIYTEKQLRENIEKLVSNEQLEKQMKDRHFKKFIKTLLFMINKQANAPVHGEGEFNYFLSLADKQVNFKIQMVNTERTHRSDS